MKNHFYIAYTGNKREEVEEIYKHLDFENIDTIIEPFCGSCAMSYYIWLQNKDKNYKFILNDNNKYLLEMFNIMRDETAIDDFNTTYNNLVSKDMTKEEYKAITKNEGLMSFFIKNKIYNRQVGLFPLDGVRSSWLNLDIRKYPVYDFFKNANIEFTNVDAIHCFNLYANSPNCMILLDPPYLSTCNDFYLCHNINIYEYLYNNPIERFSANIYLILESMWIIKLLFQHSNIKTYQKNYNGINKKKATHMIISNK